MTPLARAALVTIAALALLVGAGCGGGDTQSANDYVKSINKVQTDFASSMNSTAPAGSDPIASAKTTFQKIDTGLQKVVAELKGITPPDKVETQHQDLIREIDDLDSEVKKITTSVGGGDLQKIAAAQTVFATKAEKLQTQFAATIDQINKKLQDKSRGCARRSGSSTSASPAASSTSRIG